MLSFLHAPMAYTIPSSASSQSVRRPRTLKLSCGALGAKNSAKIPMPPLNPKDPFLSKLASVASSSPEALLNRSVNPDALPYLDLLDTPKLMAAPAEVGRSVSYNPRPKTPPPDLPSLLLDGRIVYIGMPLVPEVTELVVMEIMYLQWMDPKQPIYLYINSTGTALDDGEPVGLEANGFAIYDALMQITTDVQTLGLGAAVGQACLLLAAGTKGKRFMMPHAKALIRQPRVPSAGLMPASDALIRAKEAIKNRDTLVELLAEHTGNSVETVAEAMKSPYYMNASKAIEFGVIDKIIWRGKEKLMADVAPPEEWAKNARNRVRGGF
ncbi:ATP-dependent Clp protease proteolytic subunit-related protein 3, chloroplastic [Durio zibethinus]|uniref:ATP-dependent Clp protease proteolytic subunit n=1 Tax=Durio zibethinus TaxID=66656 RepID=A0A6P5Z2H1_DURZI|nr:ATP-dependent Clp protease proteolytic subunit-related protein 3, chloroplastic [Durio zibethinus]